MVLVLLLFVELLTVNGNVQEIILTYNFRNDDDLYEYSCYAQAAGSKVKFTFTRSLGLCIVLYFNSSSSQSAGAAVTYPSPNMYAFRQFLTHDTMSVSRNDGSNYFIAHYTGSTGQSMHCVCLHRPEKRPSTPSIIASAV